MTAAVVTATGGPRLVEGGAHRTCEPAHLLRSTGLRVSRQRVAVLTAVAAQPHMSVAEVTLHVRTTLRSVSIQTVKDVLTVCTDAGLLRRTEPAGSPARFATRTADHPHLGCRDCDTPADAARPAHDTGP